MKERFWKNIRLAMVVLLALMLVFGCTAKEPKAPQLMGGGYGCAVYTEQGCAKMIVASGGEIQVESGATLDIQSGSTFDLSGTLGLTPPLTLDGSSDVVQLTVQGHSTQTAKTFVVENSAGTDKFNVDNSGNIVAVGTSDLQGNLGDSGGTLTAVDDVMIDGAADAVQLTVQGHSTQTSKTFVVENSAGTDKFTVDNTGNLVAAGNMTLSGEYIASAAALTPSNNDILTLAASFNAINSSGDITITLGITNAVAGQMLWLYGDDAHTVLVADTDIRTHDGAALSLGQYDLIYMIFSGTEWIQIAETADQ